MASTKRVRAKPEGEIRRSQVVTTYGPGSMVDLVHNAVLVGGLDFWSWDRRQKSPVAVSEPRLRETLAERFKVLGWPLNHHEPFLEPPVAGDDASKSCGVQVLEFPQWFVCQNPSCRALARKDSLELKGGRYVHVCGSDRRANETVPVRFLGACKNGHAQDFPWIAFAHLHSGRCSAPALTLEEGATGDFSEIHVKCACGARQSLSAAMTSSARDETHGPRLRCDGHRPWLGQDGQEPDCDEPLRLLVRTASNSYFAQVVSAISIPQPGKELEEAVFEHMDVLKAATRETLHAFRTIPKIKVALADFTDADVLGAVNAIVDGKPAALEPLRTAEFRQLVASTDESRGELPPSGATYFARRVAPEDGLPTGIERLVVASKLREVRVQIGFTRLEPITANMQGTFDLDVKPARLGLATDWLPATEVRGEGIFIQLSESAIRAWEERDAVKARDIELRGGYDAWKKTVTEAPSYPGIRFYLIHSLSHLLITAISLECGYSASAIRERLYCGPSDADPSTPMAAILLHTGSTGTEGTLGGLVEQGRKLREHLRRAYDLGKLCSNDPVCAGHSPHEDPAERWLEGAACHGCLFIAECSCERFNRYLDRALVVPTVGRPNELAFFGERP